MVLIKFIKELNNLRTLGKSETLEQIGYKSIEQNNNNHFIYVNENKNSVIVVVLGLEMKYIDLLLDLINTAKIFDFNNKNDNILDILYYLRTRIDEGTDFINDVKDKYSNKTLIFLGNSIGGFLINKILHDTNIRCYTYNSAFICENIHNENIVNYRTSGDIVSLGNIFSKYTKTIEVTFIEYLCKNNLDNFVDFIVNSHYLDFLEKYEDKQVEIDIP
jgi:hypothetical protein